MSQNLDDPKANKKKMYRRQTLRGKVVLLVGCDATFLQPIIHRLAQQGADIALVCQKQPPLNTIRQIRETVEALGRRFLFLAQVQHIAHSPNWLIQDILANLGHLDVFIDLSTFKADEIDTNGNADPADFSRWDLIQAALEAISPT